MKLIQLEYFVRIVEEQSFTKAAEKLFISQPALSKAIQSMEKELKVSLFSRKPGVATLTEDGNTVYKYAKDILSYCGNRTDELIARLGKAKEPVKFGLPPSVGSVFFSNVLLEYNEKYPQIDLQIFEGTSKQIEAMIVNSQLDLGVVVEPYENPDMELKTVFRSDAVLAVGKNHRFAKRKSVSFAELDSEPMVLVSKEYMFYDQILQRCAEAGFVPQVTFTSSQWDLLLEMVAENKGVTIICRPLVEKLYSGRVVCVPLKKPEFPWTLGLIAKKNRSLPGAAKSLWDFCAKV